MKNELLLCPTMMCADFDNLHDQTIALDQAGADIFHCDIMDGNYVGNMALSPFDVKAICRNTAKPVDVHLMVSNPEVVCDLFLKTDVNIIYIHPETAKLPSKLLLSIREAGKKAGIAINPHEPLSLFEELFPLCDYVMIMTVHPGFAGQKYLDFVDRKIDRLVEIKKDHEFKIIIDGACSPDVIRRLNKKGVEGFVLGTSALFNKGQEYRVLIDQIRKDCA